MDKGKYIRFIENIFASKPGGIKQQTLEQLKEEIQLTPGQAEEVEEYIEQQVRLGLIEFIARFAHIMAQNLDGYCMLRSLGYHVQIEHNGKICTSLRQIAQHFKCTHQHIHQLTEDFAKRLGMDIKSFESTAIQKRKKKVIEYPKGYISMGKAIRKYGTTRIKLLRHLRTNNIPTKQWTNKSTIFEEKRIEGVKLRNPRKKK